MFLLVFDHIHEIDTYKYNFADHVLYGVNMIQQLCKHKRSQEYLRNFIKDYSIYKNVII